MPAHTHRDTNTYYNDIMYVHIYIYKYMYMCVCKDLSWLPGAIPIVYIYKALLKDSDVIKCAYVCLAISKTDCICMQCVDVCACAMGFVCVCACEWMCSTCCSMIPHASIDVRSLRFLSGDDVASYTPRQSTRPFDNPSIMQHHLKHKTGLAKRKLSRSKPQDLSIRVETSSMDILCRK